MKESFKEDLKSMIRFKKLRPSHILDENGIILPIPFTEMGVEDREGNVVSKSTTTDGVEE
jgi:hypothetical protein